MLTAALLLGAAASAQAATPFTAGATGSDPNLAVADNGAGHVVWPTPNPSTIGYCRVPAGGSACDRTETLTFPGGPSPNENGAFVFAPTGTSKVVVVAGCWSCGAGGITDRVYQWTSNDGGASFGAATSIHGAAGFNPEGGTPTWLEDAGGVFVGVGGGKLQALPPGASPAITQSAFGTNYGPAVARIPATNTLVSAVNDLDTISYNVYSGASLAPVAINTQASWSGPKLLTGAEGDNDTSVVSAGPSGLFLVYRRAMSGDAQVGLRRFDTGTKTFGAPAYIAGDDPIDHNSLDHPNAMVDAAGRVHAVWRTLYDGGRLRYTVSDTTGTSFAAPVSVAAHETIVRPRVAAGPDGKGFAVWTAVGVGPIRAVALEALAETPAAGGGTLPGTPSGPGTTTTTPGGTGTTTPTTPTRRPSPVRTTTARVPGATVSFGVPRGCVVRGRTFTVTLRWKKQKRKGNKFVKVRRADFYIGTKRVRIDRKAPFRQRLRVTAKARKGSKITVRARAFIKVKRGKSPTKSIRAAVRVCP